MIDSADWIFDYDLSNKIEYLGKVNSSSAIEAKLSGKYITGFRITIRQSTLEDAEIKSNNRANNLKNYLTIQSGMPTSVNLIGYHNIPKENGLSRVHGTLRLLYSITGGIDNLDLNDENVKSIINYSDTKSLELENFSKAIFHRYNNNQEDCIKGLVRTVDGDKRFPDYEKYESLRDLFSHKPPYYELTISKFRQ